MTDTAEKLDNILNGIDTNKVIELAMYSPVYEMVSKAIPVELNIQVE